MRWSRLMPWVVKQKSRKKLSLLGLWMICLLGQRELVQSGEDPSQLSPALAVKAVQSILRDYRVRPESPGETLGSLLVKSHRDRYIRNGSKTSRNYPRKKKKNKSAPQKSSP